MLQHRPPWKLNLLCCLKKKFIKNILTSDYTGELMNYYFTKININQPPPPPQDFHLGENQILHTL